MQASTVCGSLAASLLALGMASSADAAGDAEKCLASKIKAVSKYESCLYKAEAVAVIKEITPDTSKCETKFGEAWPKIETKYGLDCPTVGDQTTRHDDSEAHVAITVAELKNEAPQCGNNEVEAGEECDGTDFGVETCATQGFDEGGVLACNPDCTISTASCDECDIHEQTGCDGGEGCYTVNGSGELCAGAGTATEGQACMFANSCVPGMMCVNPGPTCQEICDTLDDDPGCTIPEVCTAIGDPADADLGVCTE